MDRTKTGKHILLFYHPYLVFVGPNKPNIYDPYVFLFLYYFDLFVFRSSMDQNI